jgi:hypothetical protein
MSDKSASHVSGLPIRDVNTPTIQRLDHFYRYPLGCAEPPAPELRRSWSQGNHSFAVHRHLGQSANH